MKIKPWQNSKRITLNPGEHCVTNENVVITTLLGSCVSACLYDPYSKIVGMNHFLLSSRRYARNAPLSTTDAGRYGIHSMELLMNEMWNRGAKRDNLRAKAFGGASLLQPADTSSGSFFAVGEVNVRFILEFLQNENIPLVAYALGGAVGRVIHFNSADFSVHVRKIRVRSANIAIKEKQYWEKTIQKQEESKTQIDLW
jgi:chemotaxis protein CheD